MNETRKQQIRNGWDVVRPILRQYLARESRSDRWGPISMKETHAQDLFDDEEKNVDNLDAEVVTSHFVNGDQIDTGPEGDPIYEKVALKGGSWRRFNAFLTWAENQGHITTGQKSTCIAFFKRVRVIQILSVDARRNLDDDMVGWQITLGIRARGDGLRRVWTTTIWMARPDSEDPALGEPEIEE